MRLACARKGSLRSARPESPSHRAASACSIIECRGACPVGGGRWAVGGGRRAAGGGRWAVAVVLATAAVLAATCEPVGATLSPWRSSKEGGGCGSSGSRLACGRSSSKGATTPARRSSSRHEVRMSYLHSASTPVAVAWRWRGGGDGGGGGGPCAEAGRADVLLDVRAVDEGGVDGALRDARRARVSGGVSGGPAWEG